MLQAEAAVGRTVVALERALPLEHGGYHESLPARGGAHVEHVHARFHREHFCGKNRGLVQKIGFQGLPELQPDSIALALQGFKQGGPTLAVHLFEVVEEFHTSYWSLVIGHWLQPIDLWYF